MIVIGRENCTVYIDGVLSNTAGNLLELFFRLEIHKVCWKLSG